MKITSILLSLLLALSMLSVSCISSNRHNNNGIGNNDSFCPPGQKKKGNC